LPTDSALCGSHKAGSETGGLNIVALTLTPRRVFEAAPFSEERRMELEENLEGDAFITEYGLVIHWSWLELYKWYKWESEEIGARRAFWGVVYRLLDNPTPQDIEFIKNRLNYNSKVFGFSDPTKETPREELLKRLEHSFFV
jgi:hypothetical protein